MAARDAILEAAASLLAASGMDRLTIGRVARRANVSSALVHYHFATKRRLLEVVAQRQARRRTEQRAAGLGAGPALAALDGLWAALTSASDAAAELSCLDLAVSRRGERGADAIRAALASEREREMALVSGALPRVLAGLGGRAGIPLDDLAGVVSIFLDGAAQALASGRAPREVRASFDAFWLALVGPGQGPPGR